MGLAFAAHLLQKVSPQTCLSDIRYMIQQFVTLCQENSTAGYTEGALEALGFAAQSLNPHVVALIDQQLTGISADLVSYFWHGVGRALYFAPTNFVPCGSWTCRVVDRTRYEVPHEVGRLNALAGLSWALTLVNIRHPDVIEMFVKRCGDRLCEDDAFVNGFSSAIMIWHNWAPSTPYLEALCKYQPDSSNAVLVRRWNNLVKGPCIIALERFFPVVEKQKLFGRLFRYQSLGDLVSQE